MAEALLTVLLYHCSTCTYQHPNKLSHQVPTDTFQSVASSYYRLLFGLKFSQQSLNVHYFSTCTHQNPTKLLYQVPINTFQSVVSSYYRHIFLHTGILTLQCTKLLTKFQFLLTSFKSKFRDNTLIISIHQNN